MTAVVEHLFLEILPQSLDEVEVGCIGWEEEELDAGGRQVFCDPPRAVVAGVVADDVDPRCQGVGKLQLIEQREPRRTAPPAPGARGRRRR